MKSTGIFPRALLTLFYRLQESVHHVPELRIDMRYFEQSAHLEGSDKVDEPLVDDVAREQFERGMRLFVV